MGVERAVVGDAAVVDVVNGEVGFQPFGFGILGEARERGVAV